MKVLVLMSTYNGDRYLREQIDSILAQEDVEVQLLVRDDGSKDKTCDILDEYASQYENIKILKSNNVGFVKSFSKLLSIAQNYKHQLDYFAFSDQDDVWKPKKLKIACEHLSRMNQNLPLLFTSNSECTDKNMNILGLFHQKEPYRTKENVMIYATEQGCSMVFNKKAVELYNLHHPVISWHDRWMSFICNFFGEMYYTHEPLFYYRLHENNTLGGKTSLYQRLLNTFIIIAKKDRDSYPMIKEFYQLYETSLSDTDKKIIRIYIHYKNRLKYKWILITSQRFQENLIAWNRLKKSVLVIINRL